MAVLDTFITLEDGRKLGFLECGDPQGKPIFYFHGFPCSRLQASDFHEHAQKNHVRFFGIDRPGQGLSTFNKKQTMLSFSQDIIAFANQFKIDKFSMVGHSGGVPYLLACAYMFPERLSGAAIVSGIAPVTDLRFKIGMPKSMVVTSFLVKTIPDFAFLLMKIQQKLLLKPKLFNQFIEKLPLPDRKILKDPNQRSKMLAAMSEAFRQGVRGVAKDMQLILTPWGFDLEKIHYPITIWQGKLDEQVPPSHAEIYKTRLSKSKEKLFETDGHISILYNHIEEIFGSLRDK